MNPKTVFFNPESKETPPSWDLTRHLLPEAQGRAFNPSQIAELHTEVTDIRLKYMEELSPRIAAAIDGGDVETLAGAISYAAGVDTFMQRTREFQSLYNTQFFRAFDRGDMVAMGKKFEENIQQLGKERQQVGQALGRMSPVMQQEIYDAHPRLASAGYMFWLPPPPTAYPSMPVKQHGLEPDLTKGKSSTEVFNDVQAKDKIGMKDRKMLAEALSLKFANEGVAAESAGFSSVLGQFEHMNGIVPGYTDALMQGIAAAKEPLSPEMDRAKEIIERHRVHYPPTQISWDQAQQHVIQAFDEFHPVLGALAAQAFEDGWVDAQRSEYKRNAEAASAASGLPQRQWANGHPYITLSFAGDVRSCAILAHELAHGFAQYMEGLSPEAMQELQQHGNITPALRPADQWGRLSNMPLHETIAHIGEKVMESHMLRAVEGEPSAFGMQQDLMNRHNHHAYPDIGRFNAEKRLREGMAENDYKDMLKPSTIRNVFMEEHARSAPVGSPKIPRGDRDELWQNSWHMFVGPPCYNASYVFAEAASRNVATLLAQSDDATAQDIRQRVVNVMASGSEMNQKWNAAMEYIGVDPQSPEFIQNARHFMPTQFAPAITSEAGRQRAQEQAVQAEKTPFDWAREQADQVRETYRRQGENILREALAPAPERGQSQMPLEGQNLSPPPSPPVASETHSSRRR